MKYRNQTPNAVQFPYIGMYETAPNTIPLPAVVRLRCDKCGRKGQYARKRYQELSYVEGRGTSLVQFARWAGCPKALAQDDKTYSDRCGVVHDWTPEQKAAIMARRAPE